MPDCVALLCDSCQTKRRIPVHEKLHFAKLLFACVAEQIPLEKCVPFVPAWMRPLFCLLCALSLFIFNVFCSDFPVKDKTKVYTKGSPSSLKIGTPRLSKFQEFLTKTPMPNEKRVVLVSDLTCIPDW